MKREFRSDRHEAIDRAFPPEPARVRIGPAPRPRPTTSRRMRIRALLSKVARHFRSPL